MAETAYERLAREVREHLGEPGTLLPSEAELSERHGVSRNTVRRALGLLEAEGLITSSQGSRREVRGVKRWCWPMHQWEERQRHSADEDAWAASIRGQGGTPSTEVTVRVVEADDDLAQSLDVEPGAPVVVRERVRSVDGEPHQLADSYFPKWLTDAHPEFMKPGDISAPGGLLAAAGLAQARVYDAISARMPTTDEAAALRIGPGTPLMVHHRTGYDTQERPVRHMITRAAADRVEISYGLEFP